MHFCADELLMLMPALSGLLYLWNRIRGGRRGFVHQACGHDCTGCDLRAALAEGADADKDSDK